MNLLKLPEICLYEIYKNLSYENITQLQFVNGILFKSLNSFKSKNYLIELRRLYWKFQKEPSKIIIESISTFKCNQEDRLYVDVYTKVCVSLGYNYKNNNYTQKHLGIAAIFKQKNVLEYIHKNCNVHLGDEPHCRCWWHIFKNYGNDIAILNCFLNCPNCHLHFTEYYLFGCNNNIKLYECYLDKHYHELIDDFILVEDHMNKKARHMNKKEVIEYVLSYNSTLYLSNLIISPIIDNLAGYNNLHFMKQLLKNFMYPKLEKIHLTNIMEHLSSKYIEEGLKYLLQYYDIQNCFLAVLEIYSVRFKFDCFNYLYKNLPCKFNAMKKRSARFMITKLANTVWSVQTNILDLKILCIFFYTNLEKKAIIGASWRSACGTFAPLGTKIICPLMSQPEIQDSLRNMDSLLDLDIAYHDPFLFWNLFYLSKDKTIENAVRQLMPGVRREKRRKVEKI